MMCRHDGNIQFQFHSDRLGWWNIVDWVKGTIHSRPPGGNKSPESCGGRPDCKKEDDANFLSVNWTVMKRITELNRAELIYVSITRSWWWSMFGSGLQSSRPPQPTCEYPSPSPKCVYICVYIYICWVKNLKTFFNKILKHFVFGKCQKSFFFLALYYFFLNFCWF